MILDPEGVYKNESIEDVLLHLALRTPYPSIDRMYVNYKFETVADGRLPKTYQRLVREDKLLENEKPLPEKGLNWKESRFMTEKKYGIV